MFKNTKISTKLADGFALLIVVLTIVGGIGFFKISDVQQIVADVSDTHVPLLELTSEIDVLATEQELAATQYALHKDGKFLTEFDALDEQVDRKFEQVKEFISAVRPPAVRLQRAGGSELSRRLPSPAAYFAPS